MRACSYDRRVNRKPVEGELIRVLLVGGLMIGGLILTGVVSADELVDDYLETYFRTFPSRATAAGRHDFDTALEHLDPAEIEAWLDYNRKVVLAARALVEDEAVDREERWDLELLMRQAQEVVFDLEILDRPAHDPLFWSGMLSNATVFLLVRDDLPPEVRLRSAATRAAKIPQLADQARAALGAGDRKRIPTEICSMAAGQVRASAVFYREGFARAAGEDADLAKVMSVAGARAADALEDLGQFLERLATEASGSPRLGSHYAERFRIVTGIEEPVDQVLSGAKESLVAKRKETAEYGRQVWSSVMGEAAPPSDDLDLIGRLFERVATDSAKDIDEFIDTYRRLIDESTEFVRQHDIVTLPEPLTLLTDRSPSFFVGQSVGGVYPAGPYASDEAATLLFLPTPSDEATAEQKAAFFRDFNQHFNAMITPHEIIPGHYLQLKYAARHPHKVRALFGDGVYIEGWGTFAERLMLDLGWGGPLDRLAHLKKQMENIARTIVDIQVHTQGMTREEVLDFVRDEALQDAQFAGNMWRRSMTSSPQLTTYYLGYQQVFGLYDDVRKARGEKFRLKDFMDGMMEMGPIPVKYYRERMLGSPAVESARGI